MNEKVSQEFEDEISLSDLLELLRKYALLVLLTAAFAAALAFVVSAREPKVYRATAKVIVSFESTARAASDVVIEPPPLDLSTYQEVARSPEVLEQALGRPLDPETLARVAQRYRIDTMEGRRSGVLLLRVEAEAPDRAAAAANRWAEALLAWEQERALGTIQRQKKALTAQLAALQGELANLDPKSERYLSLALLKAQIQQKYDQLEVLEAGTQPRLHLLEPARPPAGSVRPRPLLNAALAGALTAFLAVFLAFFKEAVTPYLRDPEEAARLSGLPVLAEFPRLPPRPGVELPHETALFLKTGLKTALLADDPSIVLVTSTVEGEGKTSVALALAQALAQEGKPTLLVDADLRAPALRERLRLPQGPGILQALSTLEDTARQIAPNLHTITCSAPPRDPAEILGQHFKGWIRFHSERRAYRYIVIDSAPLLPVVDTLALAPHATALVLVASEGRTSKKNLTTALGILQNIGVRPTGLVMNRVRNPSTVFVGGYGYGYGYGKRKRRVRA
ncbi:CpsD/CapB family tyrosine-protein kinase [Oceanithermus sp.]|uniref:polysaccharide biosynthesis tyrosine autokinase n=1 Tax=Oceanithermus sp. TaxID=2268145 RepID=UPI00257C26A9|nr:CpsD/CapB family tyrosine-protein kinase [Oceanithermus sp.]